MMQLEEEVIIVSYDLNGSGRRTGQKVFGGSVNASMQGKNGSKLDISLHPDGSELLPMQWDSWWNIAFLLDKKENH